MKWTIRGRLFMSFLFILLAVLAVTGVTYYFNRQMLASYQSYERENQKVKLAKDFQVSVADQVTNQLTFMITRDAANQRNFEEGDKRTTQILSTMKGLASAKEETDRLRELELNYAAWKATAQAAFSRSGDADEYTGLKIDLMNSRTQIEVLMKLSSDLVAHHETALKAIASEFQSHVSSANRISTILSLASALLVLLLIWIVPRTIVAPIKRLSEAITRVADGDLSVAVQADSKDELGHLAQAFSKMVENLKNVIGAAIDAVSKVNSSSQQLAAASENVGKSAVEVASTVEQLAQGAEQQAKMSAEASSTITQMSGAIQQIAANASNVAQDSSKAAQLAKQGREALAQATQQIGSIEKAVESAAQLVRTLGDRSREIGQIVDVITNIAAQTNLLALNAAIEAARAGDQGRGFAVVAEEVRKLAEQSRAAASKISELAQGIQQDTGLAVQGMETGTKEVAQGIQVVSMAVQAFEEIKRAVDSIVNQVHEVSAATQQLAAGSNQIVKTVETIAAATQQVAAGGQQVSARAQGQSASVQQISSEANALAEMAANLQQTVARFRLTEAGASA
ncbi:MAG TPA: methyl-accepting chemotaxis protein [Firmicutes bacterium]|nr:methyl-accepting chemotaxis protein [Bacillota bacterium]